MSGRWGEREGDTESKAGSRLRAVSTEPIVGLEPMSSEIMTLGKVGHNRLSHPGAPILFFIFFKSLFIFERDRGHKWGRGREREGDTKSKASLARLLLET